MILKIKQGGVQKTETPKRAKKNYIQTGMIRTYFYKDRNGKTQVRRELISVGD